MPNSSLPYLTSKSVPSLTDLTYVAKDDLAGWYTDSKASVSTMKSFCSASSTTAKTSDYSIPIEECDGRWFSTKGASGQIKFSLPASVEEMEVGFIIEESLAYTELEPYYNDMIRPLSSTDGQSVFGMNYGGTIRLRGIRDGWYIVSSYGTWNLIGSSSSSSSESLSSSCSSWYSSSSSCSSESLSSSCSSWYSSSCSSSFSSESMSSCSSSSNSCSSSSSCSSWCSSSSSSSLDYTDTIWGGGFIV